MSLNHLRNRNPKKQKSSNAFNILDFDPSYETINQILSYRIDLLFFLHTISCMPVLKSEQLEDIHLIELNNQLLHIQLQLQSYISQQYILVTSTSKLMESILGYALNQTKMSAQEKNSTNAFLEMHGGGISIARIFIYFACLCATALIYLDNPNKPNEEYASLEHSTYNVYDRNMGKTLVMKHKSASIPSIMNKQSTAISNNIVSNAVNIRKALQKRNQLTEKKAGIWKTLLNSIVKIIPTASEEIEQYVKDYNNILSNIGDEASDVCNQMMKLAYNNNVFLNFRFMHEVKSIEKKYAQLQEEKKEFMEKQSESKSKTLISSLFSVVTGDILTPTSYIMDIASSWNADPGNVLSKEDMSAIANIENFVFEREDLTELEKGQLSKQIYSSSSQYCIESFGMELVYDKGEIYMKGDKMNLQTVIETLETIKYNINAKRMTYEGNEKHKQIYESLKQKFNALIYIADRMNNMVDLEMFNILNKKVNINMEDPIAGVYKYLDKESDKLNELIRLSKMEFPKDEEDKLEIERANTAFMNIQNEYKKEEMRINTFQSEHIKKEAEMEAELFRARMEAYTKLYLSAPVYSIMHSATNVASQIIKAPLVEGSYQMYDTIRSIFLTLIKDGDATCYLILSGMMLTFVFMLSLVAQTINAFVISPVTRTVNMTVRIVSFPFRIIYRMVAMPFGLMQTDQVTAIDSNQNNNQILRISGPKKMSNKSNQKVKRVTRNNVAKRVSKHMRPSSAFRKTKSKTFKINTKMPRISKIQGIYKLPKLPKTQ